MGTNQNQKRAVTRVSAGLRLDQGVKVRPRCSSSCSMPSPAKTAARAAPAPCSRGPSCSACSVSTSASGAMCWWPCGGSSSAEHGDAITQRNRCARWPPIRPLADGSTDGSRPIADGGRWLVLPGPGRRRAQPTLDKTRKRRVTAMGREREFAIEPANGHSGRGADSPRVAGGGHGKMSGGLFAPAQTKFVRKPRGRTGTGQCRPRVH